MTSPMSHDSDFQSFEKCLEKRRLIVLVQMGMIHETEAVCKITCDADLVTCAAGCCSAAASSLFGLPNGIGRHVPQTATAACLF